MPVIRATSFDKKQKKVIVLSLKSIHETNIYYALDLGKSYRLIDESMLESLGLTEQQVKEMSLFNIRKLKMNIKQMKLKETFSIL